MKVTTYGRPPHIPPDVFRGWSTIKAINRWIYIDGILVSSWIQRRQRLGRPVPFKTHLGVTRLYRLADIVAIARGSGAELQVSEEYLLNQDLSITVSQLTKLKADLKVLEDIQKVMVEQPALLQPLAPYIHAEADIVNAAAPMKSRPGIYFLIKDRKVIYVGQSVNYMARLANHEHLKKEFDSVAFLPCPENLLSHIESFYIHILRPRLNGQHNSGKMVAPVSREAITLSMLFQAAKG